MNRILRRMSWYGFDIGNSAHALIVSTVGFVLYFKQYLMNNSATADSSWALLTALLLIVSAVVSPLIASWALDKRRRGVSLLLTTGMCVGATALLGTSLSERLEIAVALYLISALGYYLALPIYNSLLPDIVDAEEIEKASAAGWGLGYLGGIISVAVCLGLGFLTASVTGNPEVFRKIFFVAALINLLFSVPILYYGLRIDARDEPRSNQWNLRRIAEFFQQQPKLLRLLISYWFVSEASTVVIYFTALLLSSKSGMSAADILILTLKIQAIAIVTTFLIGQISEKLGSSLTYRLVVVIWFAILVGLWVFTQVDVSYWIFAALAGVVLGSHHTIVRSEITKRVAGAEGVSKSASGGLFGFLEVAGRVAQVAGPLIVGFIAYFASLSTAILVMAVFPILSLVVIWNYSWLDES